MGAGSKRGRWGGVGDGCFQLGCDGSGRGQAVGGISSVTAG